MSSKAPSNALPNIATAGLMVLLPAIACRKLLVGLLMRPRTCDAFNHMVLHGPIGAYNRGALSLNYFEHGFIRRGLGGTLLRGIAGSPLAGCVDELLVFHLLSAIWLTIPLALLVKWTIGRDRKAAAWLAILLVASPQLFWAWGGDLGRIDMFVEGCLAWGVIALLRGYVWAAIGSILLGFLAHENAAFYGFPLLGAVHFCTRPRDRRRSAFLPAAALIGGIAVIAVAQMAFTTASTQDIVHAVVRSQLPSEKRDFAAYIAVSGVRGIATSLCRSMGRAATPLYLASALALIALYAWLLRIRFKKSIPYALITALPFTVVSMVAVDYGRWLSYALLNAWLFAAVTIEPGQRSPFRKLDSILRVIVLGGLVIMRPAHIQYPNYFAKVIAQHIWSKKGTRPRRIDACDPSWRSSIGLPVIPDYPDPG